MVHPLGEFGDFRGEMNEFLGAMGETFGAMTKEVGAKRAAERFPSVPPRV